MATAPGYRFFTPVILGIVGVAWLSLVLWGRSPYARYMQHADLAGNDLGRSSGHLHHAEVVGNDLGLSSGLLLVFVAGWTLMTIAMMLPTSLPLLRLFQRMTTARPDGARLVALLIAGYLAVWTGFGVAAHVANLGIHQAVARFALVEHNEWVIGAGALFVAGLYQFTTLKYKCLDTCRSPRSFILSRWRGSHKDRHSFLLGVQHGAFCVGCCWSLMLLMFLVGAGSMFWMLLIGGVMAIEKNLPWGRRLSAPLGVTLVSLGCVVSLSAIA